MRKRSRSSSTNGRYRNRNNSKASRMGNTKIPRIRSPESHERSTDSDGLILYPKCVRFIQI